MAAFHFKLTEPRLRFPFVASEQDGAAKAAHGQDLAELADRKMAIAIDPTFDRAGPFGLASVETENKAEAEALGAADPVIMAGLGFSPEIARIPSLILRQS